MTIKLSFDKERLLAMMQLTRKHGTEGESIFIERYILPMNPVVKSVSGLTQEGGNNHQTAAVAAYIVEVPDDSGHVPPILFSAHVDTVHAADAPVKQEIVYDEESGYVYKTDGMVLGADNAAGCAVLLHMIECGVPGAYIFHRGEEVGGIGSAAMARHHADWLKRFKWAIAFDRKGNDSIITQMMTGETASDEFADAFALLLNNNTRFNYGPDETGTFTDTANYAHIIPECTNVSVGYAYEHTKDEILDLWHVKELAERLVDVFGHGFELPVVRTPAPARSMFGGGWWGDEFFMDESFSADDVLSMGFKSVADYVRNNAARDVAMLIMDLAERVQELEEEREDAKALGWYNETYGVTKEAWDEEDNIRY